MHRFCCALALLVAASHAEDATEMDEKWVQDGLAAQISKYQSTTFLNHPHQKGVVAANCESELAWWSSLRVFHHTGDKIDWVAKVPGNLSIPQNNYVLACSWEHLRALDLTVLKVFDSSHMGNGNLSLYALEGHDLRLLLQTRAVDQHNEAGHGERKWAEIFRNGRLSINFRVPDGAKVEAAFFSGDIVSIDDKRKEQSSRPYSEIWLWDSGQRIFKQQTP